MKKIIVGGDGAAVVIFQKRVLNVSICICCIEQTKDRSICSNYL